jgi:hypothetical protein
MTATRPLSRDEKSFIASLLKNHPEGKTMAASLADAVVEAMEDGGMGSLRFIHPAGPAPRYGRTIAEATAADEDGVPLSITLSIDQHGRLFELDVWKVDNSRLRRFPKPVRQAN